MVLFRHESLFTIFKSVEIIVADELASCIEKDALGVKTLTLRVHHDLTTMEKRKKKPKNRVGASGILLRQVWYEEWAESENFRRTAAPVDP